jgi:hypothetical protein
MIQPEFLAWVTATMRVWWLSGVARQLAEATPSDGTGGSSGKGTITVGASSLGSSSGGRSIGGSAGMAAGRTGGNVSSANPIAPADAVFNLIKVHSDRKHGGTK